MKSYVNLVQSCKFIMWIWTFVKLRMELNHGSMSEKYFVCCLYSLYMFIQTIDLIHWNILHKTLFTTAKYIQPRNPEKRKSASWLYSWTKISGKLQCWCPHQLKITAAVKTPCSSVKSGIWWLPLFSQFLTLFSNNNESHWDHSLQQQCFNKTETEPDPES